MSMRNRHRSSCSYRSNLTPNGSVSRLFLLLLFLAGFSSLSFAQGRYTVNRPITSSSEFTPIEEKAAPQQAGTIPWGTDYENARQTAVSSGQQLLIYLFAEKDSQETTETAPETHVRKGNTYVRQASSNQTPKSFTAACEEFDSEVLGDQFVRASLDKYVLVKLPMNTEIAAEDGTNTSILSLPGFKHMADHPGLVVIDFEQQDASYYGEVTGILPFWRGNCPTAEQAAIFLELPPGTLPQRTLTYAVRIHPDKPLSSEGEPIPPVVKVATDHAQYQAERGVLGHQNFGERSRKVIDILGSGSPSEICAQSWSDEGMYEGAMNCMRAWRNSSAHWSIARKSHRYYGYDMVAGKNGTWYAVGFFLD